MTLDAVNAHAQRLSRWSAIAIGASIPVSTALDNILLAVTFLAWLISGQIRETFRQVSNSRVSLIAMVLFILLAIGILYGNTPRQETLSTLGKYGDLLFIPLFATIFKVHQTRRYALHALAYSLAMVTFLSYLVRFDLLPQLPFISGNVASPTVFKLKLTHNVLVAFGAFLFLWLGHAAISKRARVAWLILAALAAANVLWLVQGATGYLILFVLAILAGRQIAGSRKLLAVLLGVAVIVAVGLSIPSPFQDRVTTITRELHEWNPEQSAKTSTGLRLEFYHQSLSVMARHPLMGVGTGGFPAAYEKQVAGTGKVATRNPHNEFLHLGVQVGVAGIIALVALLAAQWCLASGHPPSMERALTRGLVLTMTIGCMLNSFLLDHAEGLFYAWLTGLLCASLQQLPHSEPTQA